MEQDGFTLVRSRRQKGRQKKAQLAQSTSSSIAVGGEEKGKGKETETEKYNAFHADGKTWRHRLQQMELLFSSWNMAEIAWSGMDALKETFKEGECMILGIGSFSSSRDALLQVALIRLVINAFACRKISVFDPILDEEEIEWCQIEGWNTIKEDKNGSYHCSLPLIAYMPHCSKLLTARFIAQQLIDYYEIYIDRICDDSIAHDSSPPPPFSLCLICNGFARMAHPDVWDNTPSISDFFATLQPHIIQSPLSSLLSSSRSFTFSAFADICVHHVVGFEETGACSLRWESLIPVCRNMLVDA
jgi:hypothetical protein